MNEHKIIEVENEKSDSEDNLIIETVNKFLEKEIAKINWWLEYGKRTAFQQQQLVHRLVKNNGIPFKILP